MKHTVERTPDYILIAIVLMYIIGFSLESCSKRSDSEKTRTEVRTK